MNTSRCVTILLASLFVLCSGAHGQCEYEVTAVIQAPPCPVTGPPATVGEGMNENGTVAGWYHQCPTADSEGFYWTPGGGFHTLPRPNGVYDLEAVDINDNGIIAGNWWETDVGYRAFIYDPSIKKYTIIDPPTNKYGAFSQSKAINDDGVVAGITVSPQTGMDVGFIWNDGKLTLVSPKDGAEVLAWDINSEGEICGAVDGSITNQGQAYVADIDSFLNIGVVPNGSSGFATAINDSGQLVVDGMLAEKGEGEQFLAAFLYSNGKFTGVGNFNDYDVLNSYAMNNNAQIVGRSKSTEDVGPELPFLWQNGNLIDLNAHVAQDSVQQLRHARDINDTGQIIIEGSFPGNKTLLVSPVSNAKGDLTFDCSVDVSDLLLLLGDWGKSDSPADLNEDGTVDENDLLLVLANWGGP